MVELGAQYVVQWTSPEYRDLILGTIIPTSFILSAVSIPITRAIPLPKALKRVLNTLCAPLRNFVTPEEVMDTRCATEVRTFIERTRTLSVLALVASAGWIGCTVYGFVVKNIQYAFRALLGFMSWFYVSFVMAMKPPTIAPLPFIAFAASHVFFYLVQFSFDLVTADELSSTVTYDMVGMLIPGIFVWIAGTFPLQAVRIVHNMAGPKDEILAALATDNRDAKITAYFWTLMTFLTHLSQA
ncbi:hypothetical protein C0995_001575 [Termitomyces sp. Mi166|nr:hypothetical protein C0995_001575 [Termitomyces sp. Mi166\